MKSYIVAIALLFISGCSTTHPAVTEYRIKTDVKNLKIDNAKSCKDKSIKVASAFSSSNLMSLDMNYASDENKQFAYTQSQWAISPNNAISSQVLKLLKHLNIFKSVQISKSRTRDDLILETSIDEFIQYFDKQNNRSFVSVNISFTIIDTKNSQAISTQTFTSTIDAKTLDAEGGVKALNLALENILSQSVDWFSGVCR